MSRVGPIGRKSREKCLVALVLFTLCALCFGGIFLLPDNFGGERVIRAYKNFQKTGPEMFIPAPPLAFHGSKDDDPHVLNDRRKLEAKIKEEFGQIFDKPQLQRDVDKGIAQSESRQSLIVNIPKSRFHRANGIAESVSILIPSNITEVFGANISNIALGKITNQLPFGGHTDSNVEVVARRSKIKENKFPGILFSIVPYIVDSLHTVEVG